MSTCDSTHKQCTKCGEKKPFSDFYKHATIAGEIARRCKKCARAATMESRSKKRDDILERQRLQQKNFSPDIRQRRIEMIRRYRTEYPERLAANEIVSRAIRTGRLLSQPCWVCGEQKTHGHHVDYSRPLEVVWLCAAHHRETHALVRKPGPGSRSK